MLRLPGPGGNMLKFCGVAQSGPSGQEPEKTPTFPYGHTGYLISPNSGRIVTPVRVPLRILDHGAGGIDQPLQEKENLLTRRTNLARR